MFLSFMPIYIPKINVRYQSIDEILLIKEHWNLICREPFLTITWEPDFSQACSFCRMLMNHKNFRFTPIPDKNNDAIFLKRPKTLLFRHFLPLLPDRDFFQKIWLSHTTLSQFQENLQADGRRDRRSDGQTLFLRVFATQLGGCNK